MKKIMIVVVAALLLAVAMMVVSRSSATKAVQETSVAAVHPVRATANGAVDTRNSTERALNKLGLTMANSVQVSARK